MLHGCRRWKDITKVDHTGIGLEDVQQAFMARGCYQWWAVVNSVMRYPVP